MEPSHAPRYSNIEIEKIVTEILEHTYPQTIDIPVDIDLVAQNHSLVDNIIPIELLEGKFNIAAILQSKGETVDILIDEDTYTNQKGRANFSIAHELGHIVLHPDIWQNCHTLPDVLDMHQRINDVYRRIERNANYFAGAILMPRSRLYRHTSELYEGLVKMYTLTNPDLIRHKIWTRLAQQYGVTIQPIQIRLKEILIERKIEDAIRYQSPYLDI